MISIKNIFLLTIGAILIFVAGTFLAKCHRSKPVTEHTENRETIMGDAREKSNLDSLYREELDMVKQAYQDTLKDLKGQYKVIVQRDVRIEYRYRDAPSVARCDSVITSKNMRIGTLETIAAHQDQVAQANDSMLASYAGSIRAKDQTIYQLNAGYEQATKGLERALRPKRWGLGIMAGYGIGLEAGPVPVVAVGISYNLIRF